MSDAEMLAYSSVVWDDVYGYYDSAPPSLRSPSSASP